MTTQEFWDDLYSARERLWSGRPNHFLEILAGPLDAGSALDVGCGEGGDAVWLAGHGWTVAAADVSPVALERTSRLAAEHGVADRVSLTRVDLADEFPAGSFDLVSAQFLQTPLDFPRDVVLRSAAAAVAPGGALLIVEHAAAPPWSEHHDHEFPTVDGTLSGLRLDETWQVEIAEARERPAVGPEGQESSLLDNVIFARRATA